MYTKQQHDTIPFFSPTFLRRSSLYQNTARLGSSMGTEGLYHCTATRPDIYLIAGRSAMHATSFCQANITKCSNRRMEVTLRMAAPLLVNVLCRVSFYQYAFNNRVSIN